VERISIIDPVGGHGGMDYYDYGLAQGLARNDLDVNYYTCNKTNIRFYKNVQTYTVFTNVWERIGVFKLFAFLNAYLKAFKSARSNNSELLHFQFFGLGKINLLVLALAHLFKQKKVVTLHDIESFHKGRSKLVQNLCLNLIDGIIVHNQFSKSEFEKNFKFQGIISIIPHGNYLPFVKMQKLNINSKKINILFFGQIKEVKGIDILLSAMQKVVKKSNQYHLTIAGRPWKTEIKSYELKIKEMGLTNHVTTHFKYIKDKHVDQLYKEASIVVMPYKKIYQSGILLLSLSYGRTVIASDLPSFKELISNEKNGFLFKSGNSTSLSNCILKLNHELILNATENSKNLISKKYDWMKIGYKTLKFYQSL
jgi:glycosyltransferase involved in cell wall biosynthesis